MDANQQVDVILFAAEFNKRATPVIEYFGESWFQVVTHLNGKNRTAVLGDENDM